MQVLKRKAGLGQASSELLCWHNRNSPAGSPKLSVDSRKVLRKRAGLVIASSKLLCQVQEESIRQPQALCGLQAASEKVQRQLSVGEAADFDLDRKKYSSSA